MPALARQESGEQALQRHLAEEQFALLQGTAREAERMVQDALSRLEDPAHIGCTGSAGEFPGACQTWLYPSLLPHKVPLPAVLRAMPVAASGRAAHRDALRLSPACCLPADCLLSRTLAASECVERLRDAHGKYLSDRAGESRQPRAGAGARGSSGTHGMGGQWPLGLRHLPLFCCSRGLPAALPGPLCPPRQ